MWESIPLNSSCVALVVEVGVDVTGGGGGPYVLREAIGAESREGTSGHVLR